MGMTLMRCALAGLLVLSSLRAEDWPRWRGPDGNGISREKSWTTAWPKEGPKQLWKADVGMGFSGMAVANSRLFTMGNARDEDTVYALDAEKGTVLWQHRYPCPLDPRFYDCLLYTSPSPR